MYRLKINMILDGRMFRAGSVVENIPPHFRKRQYVEQTEQAEPENQEPASPARKIAVTPPVGSTRHSRRGS